MTALSMTLLDRVASTAPDGVGSRPGGCRGTWARARPGRSADRMAGTARTILRGRRLFDEDDAADGAFEVVRGMLRLHRLLPDGSRRIIGFLPAGRLVGLCADGVYGFAAEALTDAVVTHHSRASIDRQLAERPTAARALLQAAARELQMAHEHLVVLGGKRATEKLAGFLVMMADQQDDDAGAASLDLPMTRHDIADYLGLAVETVSRAFTALKADRILGSADGARVRILDRDRLRALASGAGS